MVMASGKQARTRGRIQIGAADPSLTAAGGMIAVTELCGKLGLIEALDEAMGPVKQRRRGFTGGQVLAGMAAAQLAGEDFLVGLDRLRADAAGQQVTPVPGLATSTATGLARRLTARHWRGAEAGLAAATARMTGLLPAERAAELAEGPVTIDIDATDVEVYGSRKRGVAYTYQGQRAGRPHVAAWAETEIPLAADLLAGDQDPRSSVVALLRRALPALPQAVRDGAAAAGQKIALRADAGYFAGDLARAAAKADMAFAIGRGLDVVARRDRNAGSPSSLSITRFAAGDRDADSSAPTGWFCFPGSAEDGLGARHVVAAVNGPDQDKTRSCGAAQSSSGPSGTILVGLMCGCVV